VSDIQEYYCQDCKCFDANGCVCESARPEEANERVRLLDTLEKLLTTRVGITIRSTDYGAIVVGCRGRSTGYFNIKDAVEWIEREEQ
jgi:hypothetical protein